jgi:hypothetical protein
MDRLYSLKEAKGLLGVCKDYESGGTGKEK